MANEEWGNSVNGGNSATGQGGTAGYDFDDSDFEDMPDDEDIFEEEEDAFEEEVYEEESVDEDWGWDADSSDEDSGRSDEEPISSDSASSNDSGKGTGNDRGMGRGKETGNADTATSADATFTTKDVVDLLDDELLPTLFKCFEKVSTNDEDKCKNISTLFIGRGLFSACTVYGIDRGVLKGAYNPDILSTYSLWGVIKPDSINVILPTDLLMCYIYSSEVALYYLYLYGGNVNEMPSNFVVLSTLGATLQGVNQSDDVTENLAGIATAINGFLGVGGASKSADGTEKSNDDKSKSDMDKANSKENNGNPVDYAMEWYNLLDASIHAFDGVKQQMLNIVQTFVVSSPKAILCNDGMGTYRFYAFDKSNKSHCCLVPYADLNKEYSNGSILSNYLVSLEQLLTNVMSSYISVESHQVLSRESNIGNKKICYPAILTSLIYHSELKYERGINGSISTLSYSYKTTADFMKKWDNLFVSIILGFIRDNIKLFPYKEENGVRKANTKGYDTTRISRYLNVLSAQLSNFVVLMDFDVSYKLSLSMSIAHFTKKEEYQPIVTSLLTGLPNTVFTVGNSSDIDIPINQCDKGNDKAGAKILSVTFISDKERYHDENNFAYKYYAKSMENGLTPSMSNIVIGELQDKRPCKLTFNNKWSVLCISAGARTGKGVLTLNILASVLAAGGTLVYCDNKPDMSRLLWDVEHEYKTEAGLSQDSAEGRVLALDLFDDPSAFDTAETYAVRKPNLNVPQVIKDGYNSWTKFGVMAEYKLLQLVTVLCSDNAYRKFNALLGETLLDPAQPLIVVVDETLATSNQIRSLIEVLSDATKRGSTASKEFQELASTYLQFFEGIDTSLSTGLISPVTKSGVVKFICIGQNVSPSNYIAGGATPAISIVNTLMKNVGIRLYGENGAHASTDNGSWGYNTKNPACRKAFGLIEQSKTTGVRGNASDAESSATEVEAVGEDKETSTNFIFWEGKDGVNMTSTSAIKVFKPYFVLNVNDYGKLLKLGVQANMVAHAPLDYATINGNNSVFVTEFINRLKTESARLSAIEHELTYVDANNERVPNDAVGFSGLLKMITPSDTPMQRLKRLSKGYDIFWGYIQVVGIAKKHGYTCLEDYLYDCSPDSLYANQLLSDLLMGKATLDVSNSTGNGSPINGTSNDGMPPDNGTSPEKFFGGRSSSGNSSGSERGTSSSANNGVNSGNTQPINPFNNGGASRPIPNPTSNPMSNPFTSPFGATANSGSGATNNVNNGTTATNSSATSRSNTTNGGNTEAKPINFNDSYAQGYKPYTGTFSCSEYDNVFNRAYNDRSVIGDLASMSKVSSAVLYNIEKMVGDLSRVTSFEVEQSGAIVINKIVFNPILSERFMQTLPFDIQQSVQHGAWIDLFNFRDIYKFPNLAILRIDNADLAEIKVRNELGMGKKSWVRIRKKLAKRLALQHLYIGGIEIGVDSDEEYNNKCGNQHKFAESCRQGFSKAGNKGATVIDTVRSSKIWNSKFASTAKTWLGWTLGSSAIMLGVSVFGIFGVIGGAFAVTKAIKSSKKGD